MTEEGAVPAAPVRSQTVGLRLLLPVMAAVVLVSAGLWIQYPGSVPPGWQQTTGTLSSVIGKRAGSSTLYYAVVQYQALGFSYQLNSKQGTSSYPSFDTTFPVAFDPELPGNAKLIDESPPNYFRGLFWGLGAIVLAGGIYSYVRGVLRLRRSVAAKAAVTEASPVADEAAQSTPEVLPAASEELDTPATDTEVIEGPPAVPAAPVAGLEEISAVPASPEPLIAVQTVLHSSEEHPPAPTTPEPIIIEPTTEPEPEPAPAPAQAQAQAKSVPKPKSPPTKIYVAALSDDEEEQPDKPLSASNLKTHLKPPAKPKPKTTKPRAAKKSTTSKSKAGSGKAKP